MLIGHLILPTNDGHPLPPFLRGFLGHLTIDIQFTLLERHLQLLLNGIFEQGHLHTKQRCHYAITYSCH